MPSTTALTTAVARTLAIIKPEACAHPVILKSVGDSIQKSGLRVARACRVRLNRQEAEELYEVHRGKFFHDRLVRHMTSGPVIALELEGDDPISTWRSILGPSKLFANLRKPSAAGYLRHQLALSDTRNVGHGSDSPAEVEREMRVFESHLKPVDSVQDIFDQVVPGHDRRGNDDDG